MDSKSLELLAEPVRIAAQALRKLCDESGVELLIYCTLRTNAEQAELYASGRTKPGRVLTNARPGESLHNPDKSGLAWAFDAVPVLHGKALFDNDAMLVTVGRLGESCGLEWAGRWSGKLREKVHFQIRRKA